MGLKVSRAAPRSRSASGGAPAGKSRFAHCVRFFYVGKYVSAIGSLPVGVGLKVSRAAPRSRSASGGAPAGKSRFAHCVRFFYVGKSVSAIGSLPVSVRLKISRAAPRSRSATTYYILISCSSSKLTVEL